MAKPTSSKNNVVDHDFVSKRIFYKKIVLIIYIFLHVHPLEDILTRGHI